MNMIDVVIILFILLCAVTGLKRGVIREAVSCIGNFLLIVISFSMMGSVADFLYGFMPFLNLGLLDVSLSALNILAYQVIAFALVYFVLSFIFKLVLSLTKVVDTLVNSLIIFNGLSKILGAIAGFISGYVVTFVILIILSIPLADNTYLHESKANNFITNKTPVLTKLTTGIRNATNDIYTLTQTISKDENKIQNSNEYNLKVLNIMLKYKVVSIDTVDKLVTEKKLDDISNLDSVLNNYR